MWIPFCSRVGSGPFRWPCFLVFHFYLFMPLLYLSANSSIVKCSWAEPLLPTCLVVAALSVDLSKMTPALSILARNWVVCISVSVSARKWTRNVILRFHIPAGFVVFLSVLRDTRIRPRILLDTESFYSEISENEVSTQRLQRKHISKATAAIVW